MGFIRDAWRKFRISGGVEIFQWQTDIDGVLFTLPKKLFENVESLVMENLLLGMQYVALRALEEQGVAARFSNGFVISNHETVNLLNDSSQDFHKLFNLPVFFSPKINISFDGLTTQVNFRAIAKITAPDGDMTAAYKLDGPFLVIGSKQYSLNIADWLFLTAVDIHSRLDVKEKTELQNNRLIYNLQGAVNKGCKASLEHFNHLKIHEPEKIGVFLTEDSNGDIVLTPSFGSGAGEEDINRRLGVIQGLKEEGMFKVGNDFFLLDKGRLEAVHEILSNRRIPQQSVKSFLKNPTAFINASLVDLENGVSARLHGATEFVQSYFGDIEKTGLDWFQSGENQQVAADELTVENIEDLEEIKILSEEAIASKSSSFIFEGQVIDISDPKAFLERIQAIEKDLINTIKDDDTSEKRATTVVDIITNENDEDEVFNVTTTEIAESEVKKQEFSRNNLLREPYIHQTEGIRWLLAHMGHGQATEGGSGVILADDMGLGKTYMILVAISEVMQRQKDAGKICLPMMLVAPVALLENWKDEIDATFRQSPFEDVVVLQGAADIKKFKITGSTKETNQNLHEGGVRFALKVGKEYGHERLDMPGRLILMSYAALRDYQFSLSKIHWFVAAFDEAQNIKNPNALQTRAAKALNADFRILATGTPVENSLKDFWCLADTATPGLLGTWQDFRVTYVVPILRQKDDPDVKLKIGLKLRSKVGNYMLRRTKEEELAGLPDKLIHTGLQVNSQSGQNNIVYDQKLSRYMKGVQLEKYQSIIDKVIASENKQGVVLTALMQMRVVSIHDDIDGMISCLPTSKNAIRLMKSSAKLGGMLRVLEKVKNRDEKVIIFVTTKKVQTVLAAVLQAIYAVQISVVNGDTKAVSMKSEETRKKIIDRFQNEPGFGIIIMSPIAAGVGLTVTGANNVIHLERHWNPAKEAQATDRVYRIGQKKEVNVYLPVSLHPDFDSFDVMLDRLLAQKTILGDAVVSPGIVESSDIVKELFN